MKLSNAPLRKLQRQAKAQGKELTQAEIDTARAVRTKKRRAGKLYR